MHDYICPNMKNLLRILSYVRSYSASALLNVLFNILTVVFSLFSVVMIVPFLQLLFGKIPFVVDKPEFQFTATYLFAYLKYILGNEIATNGHTAALIKFCV